MEDLRKYQLSNSEWDALIAFKNILVVNYTPIGKVLI